MKMFTYGLSGLLCLTMALWLQSLHADARALAIAQRVAVVLGNDPHVVLEVRPAGDGSLVVILDPVVVRSDVLRVLLSEK